MAEEQTIKIETYRLRLELHRWSDGTPQFDRLIEILGPTEVVGRQEIGRTGNTIPIFRQKRAMLSFRTRWNAGSQSGIVGVWKADEDRLFGFIPEREYAFWYDVLRTEAPLRLFYHPHEQEPDSFEGLFVSSIRLGSSSEPVGEGPKDAD